MKNDIHIFDKGMAYLPGVNAAVTIASQTRDMLEEPETDPVPLPLPNKYRGMVPWGADNDIPQKIIQESKKSPIVSVGLPFNVSMIYGNGIVYGKYEQQGKQLIFQERKDVKEINEFFENNDISRYMYEQCNDAAWFYNMFPEIAVSRNGNKIVELYHREAAFTRYEEMNHKNGKLENVFYSAKWNDNPADKDIMVIPLLSPHNTVLDLQIRMGIKPGNNGKKIQNPKHYRYIIPINIPTPGRSYYQRPAWYAIFDSGWFDFAVKIPSVKAALISNNMNIKYHVELSDDYFTRIFKSENISDPQKQEERMKKEYTDLNNFLGKSENSGKSVISFVRYDAQGKELRRMKINVLKKEITGGEYIEDSEESSNILSYGLGVHPSLIGANPGKNKNINGTEARELFIIKQAITKPIRDRLLRPFYIIKKYNQWPDDIDFAIPNLVLTTLDQGTGSQKIIS